MAATIIAASSPDPVPAAASQRTSPPREGHIEVGSGSLYTRDIGRGQPLIVLHGGPDFDTSYLLPDLDRLADGYRLIYYDQRGRGKSADGVRPEDVTMASDVDDLDKVRQHFQSQFFRQTASEIANPRH
jgi:pimeloyl-ACP methyl ester carboxylesterase